MPLIVPLVLLGRAEAADKPIAAYTNGAVSCLERAARDTGRLIMPDPPTQR